MADTQDIAARCRLRPFRESDFEDFHAVVSDFEVVRMLATWPWPPHREYTRERMQTQQVLRGNVRVIEVDGQFAGSIGGIDGGLGYMLAEKYRGQGVATWAVQQVLKRGFTEQGWERANAGCWVDNPASMAVLRKCGLREVGRRMEYCRGRGCDVESVEFEISRDDWLKLNPA